MKTALPILSPAQNVNTLLKSQPAAQETVSMATKPLLNPPKNRSGQSSQTNVQTDVLLIYPYFYTHAPKAMLFHPLGIAQLAAVLRKNALHTQVIDCTFEDHDDVISKIIHANPRIVGIYVMLSMSENAMSLAANIRNALPGALLTCGGPLPTLKPEQFSTAFEIGRASCRERV